MWLSPRAAAARTTDDGDASESNDAEVWTWRSTNDRLPPADGVDGAPPPEPRADGVDGAPSPASVGERPPRGEGPTSLNLRNERLLEEVEVLEGEARAQRDAVQRVLGDVARDAGDLGEQLVDVPQECPTARHHHALVDDVGAELGRRLLEHEADGGDELLERGLDRLHDLGARDRDRPRQTGDQVATADLHLELPLERQRGADLDLDLFGGPLADHQVVLLATDAERRRDDDPAERDDRDLARSATDVDDHVPRRAADRDVRSDRRGERLLDQVRLLRPGLQGGVANGSLLDRRDTRRDADHDLRPRQPDPALRRLGDEEAEHRLG